MSIDLDELSYPIELTNSKHTFKLLLVKNDKQQLVFNEIVAADLKDNKEIHVINDIYYLLRLTTYKKQMRIGKKLRRKYSSLNIELRLIKQQPSIHLPSLLKDLKQCILLSNSQIQNKPEAKNQLEGASSISDQSLTPKKDIGKPKKQGKNSSSSPFDKIDNSSPLQQQQQQSQQIPPQIQKKYKNVYKNCIINNIKGKCNAVADKMEIESPPPANERKNGMAREQLIIEEFLKQQQQCQQAFLQQQQQMMQQYFQMIISNYNNLKNNQIQESAEQSVEPIKMLPIGNQSQENRKMAATKTYAENNQCAFSSQKSKTKSKNNCTHTSPKVKKKTIVKPTNGGLNSDFRAEEKLLLLQQLSSSSSTTTNQSEAIIEND